MKKILLFFLASLCAILAMFLKFSDKEPKTTQLKVLRTNMMREIATFDPRIATDSESMQIGVMLFSGLTYADDQGNLSLDLAESYTLSDDQKTYRFILKDLLWSDGSPLTAYDFEESWKEYTRDDFPASLWEMVSMIKNSRGKPDKNIVQGIKALDAKTVEIELEQPTCYFLQLLAHTTLFPVHHSMRGKWLQKFDPNSIVCSGPFRIKRFAENDEILFEKNPHYHNASSVALDAIHVSRINDAQTALALFEKQELDWLGLPLSELPVDAFPDLKKRGLLRSYPLFDARFLYFNTKEFPFNNVKVRRALSLAIDRKAIIEDVLQSQDLVALNYLPVSQKKQHLHPYFHDADEQAARALFKEALEELQLSVEEFPEVCISYNTSDMWRRVMQAIQQQWRKVLGITVRLENTEWKVHLERMQRGNFKITRGGRFADFFDPLAFLKPMLSYNLTQNYCRWENAEYDALIAAAMETASSRERSELFERAESVMMQEMPIAPLYHGTSYSVCRNDLKGIAVSPLYHVDFSKAYFEKAEK